MAPSAIPLLGLLLLFPLPSNGDNGCQTSPSCGESRDVPYPFWIYDETFPSHICGYPGFMLVCKNNSTLIFPLGSDDYQVLSIDPASRTISLTDADVLSAPSGCPRVRHNLSFVFHAPPIPTHDDLAQYFDPVLEYAPSDANLTFFFNCTHGSTFNPLEEIACLAGSLDGNKSYILIGDTIPYEFDSVSCSDIVVAPVLQGELNQSATGIANSYGEVLRSGFELNWPEVSRSNNCGDCERSEGLCGMNRTSDSACVFACFCNNGSIEKYKCGGGNKKKIIIGSVTGVAGLLLLLVAVILFYKHKKKQRSQTSSSKSFLSYFSSNKSSIDPEKCSAHFQTHLFSYEELQEATNNFDASKELGEGGFGTVYKGKLQDGRTVAVKRLYENNYRRVEQFKNEIDILSRLRHPNLVNLYGCSSGQGKELLLVYEFIENGTVADHLHGSRASEGILDWSMRLNTAVETADALAYLHAIDPPIIHRDVKTCNILLDTSFHVKVADFGLSRLFPIDATHISTAPQGTPGYLDPEYHQCYQLTDKSDVYSFGVVLVELISSKPAVDITRHRKDINLANMAINRIQNGELDQLVDEGLGYQTDQKTRKMITMVAEVAFRCLLADGETRPSIKEVLEVLRSIQSEGYKISNGGEDDTENGDDVGLLKNTAPFSPDTVMNKWASRSTTPNTSE